MEALLVAADRPVSEESGGVVADVPADLKSQVVTGVSAQDGERQGKHFAGLLRKVGAVRAQSNGPARAAQSVFLCVHMDIEIDTV